VRPYCWLVSHLHNESLLQKLLLALLILNVGDMISTLWGVQMGILVEANPLLRWCLEKGILLFALIKTALCAQFILTALLLARKVKQYIIHFAILTSAIIIVYSAVVIRTFGLLI